MHLPTQLPEYPVNYKSDCDRNTIIEVHRGGNLTEYLPGCLRTQRILNALSKAEIDKPHPLVVREPVLSLEFVVALEDCPRNEGRDVRIPRFLLVDLESFRSFLVT